MTKTPKTPTAESTPQSLTVSDTLHAPVIYFDGAPNFGCNGGIVSIALAVARHLSRDGEVVSDVIAVAHLRCSVEAAVDLRSAIDNALLLGAPTEGEAN